MARVSCSPVEGRSVNDPRLDSKKQKRKIRNAMIKSETIKKAEINQATTAHKLVEKE